MVCAEHSLSRSGQGWDDGRAEKQWTWGAVGANEGTRQRLLTIPGWWRIRVVPAVWLRRGLLSRTACHPGYDPLVESKVTRLPKGGREPARRTQVAPSFSAQTQTHRRRRVNGITSKQASTKGYQQSGYGIAQPVGPKRGATRGAALTIAGGRSQTGWWPAVGRQGVYMSWVCMGSKKSVWAGGRSCVWLWCSRRKAGWQRAGRVFRRPHFHSGSMGQPTVPGGGPPQPPCPFRRLIMVNKQRTYEICIPRYGDANHCIVAHSQPCIFLVLILCLTMGLPCTERPLKGWSA